MSIKNRRQRIKVRYSNDENLIPTKSTKLNDEKLTNKPENNKGRAPVKNKARS